MITVTTFVLQLVTAFLAVGVVSGAEVSGSVQLAGSDNGLCQELGLKNGCEANSNLQAKLYDDGSVVGKLTDVSNFGDKNIILVQADVDCMKFLSIASGDKYVVVGGVYTKGDKLVDIFELDTPVVGRRFITVAKEDTDGVLFYSDNFILLTDTCDDVTDVETRDYYENVGRKANIVFPSDPVNCGDFDRKKECTKSKECEWDTNEGTCVSKDGGLGGGFRFSESFSKEEAPIQDMVNGSNSADPKMIMSGMVAGLFFALWL